MIQLNNVKILSEVLVKECGADTVMIQHDSYMSNDSGQVRLIVPHKMYFRMVEYFERQTKYIEETKKDEGK